MIKVISKILKTILPIFLFIKIQKTYIKIKNYFKFKNYDLSKDLDYNENLLTSLNYKIENIKSQLRSLGLNYNSSELSWHYHLFVGLKNYFGNKKIKILEIGTYDGEFANFISKLYSESHITTIDLHENSEQFVNTNNRDKSEKLSEFLKLRNKNLNRKNINFIKLNSLNIKKHFIEKKFDLIWIDGDHLNPQVTIDIINSLDLLDKDGIICTDDVIMDKNFRKGKYVSNEGFNTLKYLEYNEIIKNYYLIKRVRLTNAFHKKYVSFSVFKNNSLL